MMNSQIYLSLINHGLIGLIGVELVGLNELNEPNKHLVLMGLGLGFMGLMGLIIQFVSLKNSKCCCLASGKIYSNMNLNQKC